MSGDGQGVLTFCPDCGAENTAEGRCWMCFRELGSRERPAPGGATTEGSKPAPTPAETASSQPTFQVFAQSRAQPPVRMLVDADAQAEVNGQFSVTTLVAVVTLIAIGVGATAIEPGLGIAYFIVVVPALIATALRGSAMRRRFGEFSIWEKIGFFVASVAAVVGLIILLVVAACVAFFVYCLAAMG